MHLEQRSDGDGTGMKLIWRNGADGGGDPGDHERRNDSTIDWRNGAVYHFIFDWSATAFSVSIAVDGGAPQAWFQGGFSRPYAPPNHVISLGCYPRTETMTGIYRNVSITAR